MQRWLIFAESWRARPAPDCCRFDGMRSDSGTSVDSLRAVRPQLKRDALDSSTETDDAPCTPARPTSYSPTGTAVPRLAAHAQTLAASPTSLIPPAEDPIRTPSSEAPGSRWRLFAILAGVTLVVGIYLVRFVGPYLSFDPAYYDYFWPWRYALWAHLGGGCVAILTGPVQIWLGITGQRVRLHHTLGKVYLGAATLGLSGAYYLVAREIAGDWVFASGLLGLALAWTLTTGVGYLSIKRGRIEQHRDWMIRSYVVALSFVFFRVFIDVIHAFGVRSPSGTATGEEYKLAAWLCWSVPLLLAEPCIQWRHLRHPPDANAPRTAS